MPGVQQSTLWTAKQRASKYALRLARELKALESYVSWLPSAKTSQKSLPMPRTKFTFASAVNNSRSVSMRLMPLGLIYRSALYALLARGRSLFSTSPT